MTIELARHEIVGLIGPNGAGKSTLVNLLSGFDRPNQGTIELDGVDISSWSPAKRGRAGIGRTFQHGHVFAELSVQENVEVAALGVKVSPRQARAVADELLSLLQLGETRHQAAATLPHGQARLLGAARALATNPSFLLLDEPAAGLNEDEVGEFGQVIRQLSQERRVGMLFIDHNVSLVLALCDRIHVLDEGRTLAQGTPDEVRADQAVTAAYLGSP
ncbi:MAG: ABC transporter ATP-binding protein [Acidimicrobiales bacterium]